MVRYPRVIAWIVLVWICIFLLTTAGTAHAGKNEYGAMLVHTDDAHSWTNTVCDHGNTWIPDDWREFNTRTDMEWSSPALIWFIASWSEYADPAVTYVYFGNDHNLPQNYHNHWGVCGPPGSVEYPDDGWPDSPATAGNTIEFGSTVTGVTNIPFYYVDVWGFEGAHYGTGIKPNVGVACFLDDSSPMVQDDCECFGHVSWYEEGYNYDPGCNSWWGACCQVDGRCTITGWTTCYGALGGYDWLQTTECDPDPCTPPGACCRYGDCRIASEGSCADFWHGDFIAPGVPCDPNPCDETSSVAETVTEIVTWGKVKSTYK